jgi:hypothetical protein
MGEITEKRRSVIARGAGRATALGAALALAGCGSAGSAHSADAGNSAAGDGAPPVDGSVEADASPAGDASVSADGSPFGDASPADAASTGDLPWTPDPDGGCPSPGPPYGGGELAVEGGVVSATLVDLAGTPLPGFFVQVCGLDICPALQPTNDAGAVTLDSTRFSVGTPSLGYGDALHYPLLLVPVPPGPTVDLGTLVTAALPPSGAAFSPGGDAVSGDVTVTLPPGGAATVDSLVYDSADKQALRTVAIPVSKEASIPGVAANGLALLYGVSPIDTLFCPAAQVTVVNRVGWPAGARVGFYILGDDTAQPWAPYGDWALISHGAVSADGTTIRTADGEGFPLLEAFGVRLEP